MNSSDHIFEISIFDIFGLIFRELKKIVLFGLIVAVIVSGIKAVSIVSDNKDLDKLSVKQAEYQRKLFEYKKIVSDTKQNIEYAQVRLDKADEYYKNSILMNIDPYNVWTSIYQITITGVDPQIYNIALDSQSLTIDDLTYKIANRYLSLWRVVDLQNELGISEYSDVDNRYIRELVDISVNNEDTIVISVKEGSEDAARNLTNAIVNLFTSFTDDVSDTTYEHSLTLLGGSINASIDNNLSSKQINKQIEITTIANSIDEYNVQLDEAIASGAPKNPSSRRSQIKDTIKLFILGGILGAIFSGLYIVFKSIGCEKAEFSSQIVKNCGLRFLGSAANDHGFTTKAANRVAQEKSWNNVSDSENYIQESIDLYLKDKKNVLIVSTFEIAEDSPEVRSLLNLFGNSDVNASYISNAKYNSKAIQALKNSEAVIFAERNGVSLIKDIKDFTELAKQTDTEIVGFIRI